MVKIPRGFGAGSKHYGYTAFRKNKGLRVHISHFLRTNIAFRGITQEGKGSSLD
jgi:hypothetical protein